MSLCRNQFGIDGYGQSRDGWTHELDLRPSPAATNMGKAYATAIMDMTRLASSGSRSALCGFRSARTSKTILSVS